MSSGVESRWRENSERERISLEEKKKILWEGKREKGGLRFTPQWGRMLEIKEIKLR